MFRVVAPVIFAFGISACGDSTDPIADTVCGDGVVLAPEACDDGNTADGDGCSALCAVEPGYACDGSPSVCTSGCPTDCSELDGACSVGVCDANTGACVAEPVDDGVSCDDGSACTTGDVCTAGVCGGDLLDCSALDDGCSIGVCDASSGECVVETAAEGEACDDRNACTTGDLCTGGTCSGTIVDCAALDGACAVGVCDPESGGCVPEPLDDGTTCDDGSVCTFDDMCTDGVCGGASTSCPDPGPCGVASCDELTGACVIEPLEDGTACDDGSVCTSDEACRAGECVGTAPDCSALDSVCATGSCDPISGECVALPVPDDTTCDDGSLCTSDESCQDGVCVGTEPDCSALDAGACAVGACDPATGECVVANAEEGTACDDASLCTVEDECRSGVCAGVPRDCTGLDAPCAAGFCDPATGECVVDSFDNGTACSDRDRCTDGDVCLDGVCVGDAIDCSVADSVCTFGICDSLTGGCLALPVDDGTSCDVDPNDCAVNVCRAGVCEAEPLPDARSCDTNPEDCQNEVCRAGACVPEPLPDCSACGPGGEAICGGGICGGQRADLGLDFERGAIPEPLTTYGSVRWEVTTAPTFEGSFAARAGRVPGGGTSILGARLSADTTTTVRFFYRFDAADGSFEVRVDGSPVLELTRTDGWEEASFEIPARSVDVEWVYGRPLGVSDPSGSAYVDSIRVVDVNPCAGNACVDSVFNGAACILCGFAEAGTSCDPDATDCVAFSCSGRGTCEPDRLADCASCGEAGEEYCMGGSCGGVPGQQVFDFETSGQFDAFVELEGSWSVGCCTAFSGTNAVSTFGFGGTQRLGLDVALQEPGTVSFWWNTTSGRDAAFSVDGVVAATARIRDDWEQVTIPLPAGSSTLEWSVPPVATRGAPSALFIDDVVLTGQDACQEDTLCSVELSDGTDCVVCPVVDPICVAP